MVLTYVFILQHTMERAKRKHKRDTHTQIYDLQDQIKAKIVDKKVIAKRTTTLQETVKRTEDTLCHGKSKQNAQERQAQKFTTCRIK